MGQKVNPTIFRLGKVTNWKLQYFEKKPNEIATYSLKSLEIQKFIHKFFKDNGLIVQNCKIHYINENALHLYISYYLTLKSILLVTKINKQQNLKLIKSRKKYIKSRKKYIKSKKNIKNSFKRQKPFYNKDIKLNRIKKRKYADVIKNIRNYYEYQKLYYNRNLNDTILKKNFKKVKNIIKTERNMLKIRRMNLLKCFKHNIKVQNYNKVKSIKSNTFLEHLLQGLKTFLNKNIKIFLTFKQLNKNVKETFNIEKAKTIKKKLVNLKKYERNDFFKEGVNTLYTCSVETNSADLLAEFISTQLQKLKRHNFFLKFVKSTLTMFKSQNIKIKIKGRFNGAPRAKHKIILIGNGVPSLTINSVIDYAEKTSYTSNGTFGVKVWIHEKPKT